MTVELTREIRDKRIAVARDVLKQMERKDVPLKAREGVYLQGPSFGSQSQFKGESLQPYVDELQQHCEVCMIGAAFLSYARLYDGVEPGVVYIGSRLCLVASYDMRPHLETVFDGHTLDLMESVFEKCVMCESKITDDLRAAAEFGDEFNSATDAMRAICNILIKNDGEFILPAPATEDSPR